MISTLFRSSVLGELLPHRPHILLFGFLECSVMFNHSPEIPAYQIHRRLRNTLSESWRLLIKGIWSKVNFVFLPALLQAQPEFCAKHCDIISSRRCYPGFFFYPFTFFLIRSLFTQATEQCFSTFCQNTSPQNLGEMWVLILWVLFQWFWGEVWESQLVVMLFQ